MNANFKRYSRMVSRRATPRKPKAPATPHLGHAPIAWRDASWYDANWEKRPRLTLDKALKALKECAEAVKKQS